MNIGIEATSAAEAQKAGVGYYTANLLHALADLPPDAHQYTCYLRHPWRDAALQQHLAQRAPFTGKVLKFPALWAQIRLPFELWRHPQAVYFFPAPVIPLLYQPARSVVTIHDVAFLFFPECFAPRLRRWLRLATQRSMARARKIIAVSAATRNDLITHYHVPADKIVVVPHGVQPLYRPLADEPGGRELIARTQKTYGLTAPYLLCLGTLQRRKNIPRLLEAFARLKQAYKIPHQLALVGQKTSDLPENEISETLARLQLQRDVIWTGYVPEQAKPALLSGATVFVLPSLYEGFGMPLLEAMACGAPVVCANTAALPEVVGDSGLMFDPYNVENMAHTIYQALTDHDLQAKLRQQGLQRVQTFTWETCARKTLAVLEEVGSNLECKL
jgi:glycosyltransferase involved in cell wall biosynthesis